MQTCANSSWLARKPTCASTQAATQISICPWTRKELGKRKHMFRVIAPPTPHSLLYPPIINCTIVSLDFDYPVRSWRGVCVDDWGAEVPQGFDVYHWHRRRREVRSLNVDGSITRWERWWIVRPSASVVVGGAPCRAKLGVGAVGGG